MALTSEVIKANESLANLSDEQITAITTLSANDENTVISGKVKEIHDQYDKDIKDVSGVDRNQNEKTYDYAKRVLGDYKTKIESSSGLQQKITSYETKITELEKQIKEGKGDDALRKQLKDSQDQAAALKVRYEASKSEWEKEKEGYITQALDAKKNVQFEKATTGLKFKSTYPEEVQKTLLDSAISKVQGMYKTDWIKVEGKEIMVFRDETGEIVRNKANSLNPYTAQELVREQLKTVLEEKPAGGGGSKNPGAGEVHKIDLVDLASATTQTAADDMIIKYLLQTGETRGSASFAEKHAKIRKENNVNKLPIRVGY